MHLVDFHYNKNIFLLYLLTWKHYGILLARDIRTKNAPDCKVNLTWYN